MPPRPVSHSPPQPQQQPQPHLVATPLLIVLFAETPIRGPTTLEHIYKRKHVLTLQKIILLIKQALKFVSLFGNPIKKVIFCYLLNLDTRGFTESFISDVNFYLNTLNRA